MKIERFKKTTKGKYKLYLDNGEVLSLYEDVIVNNNLVLTKEINESMLDGLIAQNNDVHVYGVSINYLSIRQRSKKELEDYLIKKGASKEAISITINRLEKEGYLNDFKFAKAFSNDQMLLTNKGPYAIKRELIKRGITEEVANEVIDDIDDEIVKEKLFNLMEKQVRIKKASSSMLKIKLLNYFTNLGYEREMILKLIGGLKLKTDVTHLKKEYEKLINKYKNKYDENKLKIMVINKLYAKGYSADEINKIGGDI